jgi:hypothetical protein
MTHHAPSVVGWRRTLFEARYPHHHRGTQQDAAEHLGDDAGLVQQFEGVCAGQLDTAIKTFGSCISQCNSWQKMMTMLACVGCYVSTLARTRKPRGRAPFPACVETHVSRHRALGSGNN